MANPDTSNEDVQFESNWNLYLVLFVTLALGVCLLLLEHYGSKLYNKIVDYIKEKEQRGQEEFDIRRLESAQ